MKLISGAFEHQKTIPRKYTCQGEDRSVPLSWSNLPKGTQSLMLIVEDPDAPDPKAPKMVWNHWLLYNIPPTAKGLPEGVKPNALPAGTLQGKNSWKKTGYGGPCPPIGRHRYFHKLYALDIRLPDMDGLTATRLLKGSQQTEGIPVLAVSALARVEDRERALQAGCDGYLSKPYSIKALVEAIQDMLCVSTGS